jgi:Icc-related predicted phosphoesterase
MRIHVLSDLHIEFGEVQIPNVDCDVVVLAGDISTKHHGFFWALRQWPNVPVIYVLGNHEYYGENFPRLVDKLRVQARGTNIHVLENESIQIGKIIFFGTTLWTDFELHHDSLSAVVEAGSVMNDYKRIRNSDVHFRKLYPRDTRLWHLVSRQALAAALEGGAGANTVVVTHHAPSGLSLPERRRAKVLSAAYASPMDEFIAQYQPLLWVHGHIHHPNDYQIGRTRVLANPRAYPDEPNPKFQPDLVVEI